MKTLLIAILIALFLSLPQAAYSQKTGEAQTVIVDANKHQVLKFTNPDVNKQRCSFMVGMTKDREEAFVLPVAHLHYRLRLFDWRPPVLEIGGPESRGVSLPETGWLYITPSRIIFVVSRGDASHAFDVPRKDLKDKPVSTLKEHLPTGIQINLKERLVASDSREQKFVLLMSGDRNCQEFLEPDPYIKFLKRTINDFAGALAEFKQLTASLKQAGKISHERAALLPSDKGSAAESQAAATGETFEPQLSSDAAPPDDEPGQKGIYHMMLSAKAANEGKTEEAKANAEIALQLLKSPSHESEFYARGMAHQELGNYDLAIADFDKALELDPRQSIVYVGRGNAYKQKKNYDRALADFDRAIQLEPDLSEAYFDRGRLYTSLRDADRAIADYEKVIQLDPQWPFAYLLRGNEHFVKRNFDLAFADFDKAIKLDAQIASAYRLRGSVYAARDDHDRAIADFDKAIQLSPRDADAHHLRGFSYAIKGDSDRAINDFSKTIELDPASEYGYYGRGRAYLDRGDYDKAILDYDKVIQLNARMTAAYVDRGFAYGNKREYDRAIADFDKVLQLDPQDSGTHYNRGLAYLSKGAYDLAMADFSKAIELKPDFAWAYQHRAIAYERMGDKAKAKADSEKAVELEKQKVKP